MAWGKTSVILNMTNVSLTFGWPLCDIKRSLRLLNLNCCIKLRPMERESTRKTALEATLAQKTWSSLQSNNRFFSANYPLICPLICQSSSMVRQPLRIRIHPSHKGTSFTIKTLREGARKPSTQLSFTLNWRSPLYPPLIPFDYIFSSKIGFSPSLFAISQKNISLSAILCMAHCDALKSWEKEATHFIGRFQL